VETRRQPPDEDNDALTSTTVSDVVTLEKPEDLGYRQAIEQPGRAEGPTSAESLSLESVVQGYVRLARTR
jgi:hypothetical protein